MPLEPIKPETVKELHKTSTSHGDSSGYFSKPSAMLKPVVSDIKGLAGAAQNYFNDRINPHIEALMSPPYLQGDKHTHAKNIAHAVIQALKDLGKQF